MRLEPTEFDKLCNRLAGNSVRRAASALLFATACAHELRVQANPDGPTVTRGSATITSSGNQLNIQASHNAVLDWQHFNVNPGETTTFHQPSASSVVWNRINDINPSQILGNLNANGYVVLYNQNGFYFGAQ